MLLFDLIAEHRVVDMYENLERCCSVMVVCEYCGSVVNVYGVLKN